jgi:hypothetical protein
MNVVGEERTLPRVALDGDGGEGAGDDYVTATRARELLGINKVMLARLLGDGSLPYVPDTLDRRIKWVKLADIEALKKRSVAASAADGGSNNVGEVKRRGRARVTRKVA